MKEALTEVDELSKKTARILCAKGQAWSIDRARSRVYQCRIEEGREILKERIYESGQLMLRLC